MQSGTSSFQELATLEHPLAHYRGFRTSFTKMWQYLSPYACIFNWLITQLSACATKFCHWDFVLKYAVKGEKRTLNKGQKSGLFRDHIWTLVPIGTKSRDQGFSASIACLEEVRKSSTLAHSIVLSSLGNFVFGSSELMKIQSIYLKIVVLGESKSDQIPGHSCLSFLQALQQSLCLSLSLLCRTFPYRYTHFLSYFVAFFYWAFSHRFTHDLVAKEVYALLLKSLPRVFFSLPGVFFPFLV